jgi:hypothetical protein
MNVRLLRARGSEFGPSRDQRERNALAYRGYGWTRSVVRAR